MINKSYKKHCDPKIIGLGSNQKFEVIWSQVPKKDPRANDQNVSSILLIILSHVSVVELFDR